MLYTIKQVTPNGDIKTAAMYCNDLIPYENMISFVVSKLCKTEAHWWEESSRKKAEALITSSSHFFYYEDESGNIFSMRKYLITIQPLQRMGVYAHIFIGAIPTTARL